MNTLDCYDFYRWSMGQIRISPELESKIINELKVNNLYLGSEEYE